MVQAEQIRAGGGMSFVTASGCYPMDGSVRCTGSISTLPFAVNFFVLAAMPMILISEGT